MKILLQFDKAINHSLATRVKSKITFKVYHHLCQKYHTLYNINMLYSSDGKLFIL